MADHYEVLGVPRDAAQPDVVRSYRQLAKQFHPDQHPGASDDERNELVVAMARVNEAYEVLGKPDRRASYDIELSYAERSAAQAAQGSSTSYAPGPQATPGETTDPYNAYIRHPGEGECLMCGSRPARMFRFEHQTFFWNAGTTFVTDGQLCRSCALSYGRGKQNRTLWLGWWGYPGFVSNVSVVARNAWQLFRAGRMEEPERSNEPMFVPMSQPSNPGRSVFLRSGAFVAYAIVALILTFVLYVESRQPSRGGVSAPASVVEVEGAAVVDSA